MSMTVIDLIRSTAGLDCGALPLSQCRILRPHLLARAGLDVDGGTVCLLTVPYVVTADVDDPQRNISLYAVPRDYHLYFKGLSDELLPALRAAFPAYRFALFADHSPIAEVEAAARAGLGMIGCNGLLLTPRFGSFVFLAEVITDAPWHIVVGGDTEFSVQPPAECPACGQCLRACPGHCALGDRGECLSALTQKKGALTAEETEMLSDHPLVWGCDTCQTVCPYNRAVIARGDDTPIPFFREQRLTRIDSRTLSEMSDAAFAERAFSWRGRGVMERNVKIKERTVE